MRKWPAVLVAFALLAGSASAGQFLLIPESEADVVNMYDPFDGTFLGQFATVPLLYGTSATPINAVLGPDSLVYVSDQVQDAVFRFDLQGTFVDVFADSSDGLDNVRGIAFRANGNLLVSHSPSGTTSDAVAEFAPDGTRLADAVVGVDPFDVYVLDDGRLLVSDLAGTDAVRLYNADGSFVANVLTVSFPEQTQGDPILPGALLNAAFTTNVVSDFDLDGTVYTQFAFPGGRGVYRLGNGNLLATKGDGVWEMDALTGQLLQQESTGSARFIELVPEPSALLLLLVLGGLAALRRG